MRTTRRAALTLSLLLVSGAAAAQEEPNADMASARALGQEGVKLADQGNCAEAIDKLARAEKIFHAPTTLERLGECQVQVGRIVDGTENLNRVVREQLAANAPAAFAQAQERAKKVLETAKPKIAKLKIAVAAPADAQMTVKVDGESIPLANLNVSRPVDPGEHNVEASAPGYLTATGRVRLSEGGSDSLALTLQPDPNAPKPAPVPVAAPTPTQTPQSPNPPPAQPPPEPHSGASKVPAYAALGVGVVGIGVGTIFGVIASGKKSDLDSPGTNKVCPASSQSTIDSAKSNATISTVGFVIGGVGLAAGAVLYILSSGSSSTTGLFDGRGISGRF